MRVNIFTSDYHFLQSIRGQTDMSMGVLIMTATSFVGGYLRMKRRRDSNQGPLGREYFALTTKLGSYPCIALCSKKKLK